MASWLIGYGNLDGNSEIHMVEITRFAIMYAYYMYTWSMDMRPTPLQNMICLQMLYVLVFFVC